MSEIGGRRGWVLGTVTILVGLASACSAQPERPHGGDTERHQGEGISVKLPTGWETAATVEGLKLPPDLAGVEVNGRFTEIAHNGAYVRLVGYEGSRTTEIQASPVQLGIEDVEQAADLYVGLLADAGWTYVSRESTLVDGNPAVAIVEDYPEANARQLFVLWIEGDQGWVAGWSTSMEDFQDAEPVFEAAMETVKTERQNTIP